MNALGKVLAIGVVLAASACGHGDPPPPASPPTLTAATCPCANGAPGGGGMTCSPELMMHGGQGMGPGHGGPMMHAQPMRMGGMGAEPPAPPTANELSAETKAALLRALDEEYRAEALYDHMGTQLGAKRPIAMIARSEQRHAWVLESLALAHGVELPTNTWATTKVPDASSVAVACRTGVDSEKKTIATYDELLKLDLPQDIRRAFMHLRAAAVEHHKPAFEACR